MDIRPSLKKLSQYCVRVGISFDIFINVLLGGHINQTFSARNWAWKKENKPNLVWLIDFVIFKDKHHCMSSWVYWHTKKNNLRKITKSNVEIVRR